MVENIEEDIQALGIKGWRKVSKERTEWKIIAPADLNGLVRFVDRRNLVSVRVPSHFNWPLHTIELGP